MSRRHIIVAIDGPAGAGKSTIARAVARRLGFVYIDSGAMYRAVALWAIRAGVDLSDMHRLEQLARESIIEFSSSGAVFLNGEDVSREIREPHVAEAASRVSAVAGVRRALVEIQRAIGESNNVVMEGRDIASVVFPDARVKIFLDADPPVRAERRARETGASPSQMQEQIAQRDARDRTRAEAPLVQAPDAIYLDTTRLSPEETEEAVLRIVRERTSNGHAAPEATEIIPS